MGDFSKLSYKCSLPNMICFSDHVTLKSKLLYKHDAKEKIMLYKVSMVDKLNKVYEWKGSKFFDKGIVGIPYSCDIYYPQKPISKDLKLTLEFLSESGDKGVIEYIFSDWNTPHLSDVKRLRMTDDDKRYFYKKFFESKSVKANINFANQNDDLKSELNGFTNGLKNGLSTSTITTPVIPGLEIYVEALRTEKNFLKHEGGRKYKVTNGKYIGCSKGGAFSYVFDLESELYIADDSPISLLLSGGVEAISGYVLMCEDFQIIVLLEKNIGEKISSAQICVEPWKLLEALEKRLYHGMSIGSKIAKDMFGKGPDLATKEPIEKIEKGHDAVVRRAKEEPITIVWGPPGTGKTHTMSEIAIDFLKKDKKVLIVSHSNVSVDGVAKKIYELLKKSGENNLYKSGRVLRYGYIRDEELSLNEHISSFKYAVKQSPELDAQLEKLQQEYIKIKKTSGIAHPKVVEIHQKISEIRGIIREEEQKKVARANVVATTISKVVIDKLFENLRYDVVMFDEVSMAYVPQIAAAATFAKEHFICVGDFMQLAPIAQSQAKDVLCRDIFTCLGINANGTPYFHPWLVMLDEQRRMHPRISAFANKYIYKNLLKDHESVKKQKDYIVNATPFVGEPVNYIDLTGCYCASEKNQDNSRFNIMSAVISFATAIKAEENMRGTDDQKSRVSIITPYVAQTRLVRALVQDYRENAQTYIRCATVHQFQGSESNLIVFDAVESYPGAKVGFLMGKDMNFIMRLINVAVTRAKGKLITVANSKFWDNGFKDKPNHTFYRLQKYSLAEGNHIRHMNGGSLDNHISNLELGKLADFYMNPLDYIETLENDLIKAKGKIVISLPAGNINNEIGDRVFKQLMTARARGVQMLVKSNDYINLPDKWKAITWGTENAISPILMIDDQITWYGAPDANYTFKVDKGKSINTVCKFSFRIKGQYTAEIIKSLSSLEFREINGKLSPLMEKDSATKMIDMPSGKGAAGFAAYIEETKKCPVCKEIMKMAKSKSGKFYIKCSDKDCDGFHPYVDVSDVNHYICVNYTKCSTCGGVLEAKTGKYGLYIRCLKCGAFVRLDEI